MPVCRPVLIACVLVALVAAGCSRDPTASDEYQTLQSEYDTLAGAMDGVDQMRQQLLYQRDDLLAINEQLDQELAAVIAERDAMAAADPSEACTDKLVRCEEMLFPPIDDEEWPPSSPAVWFPSSGGYVTNEPTILVAVFASQSVIVTVNGTVATQSSDDWVGGNAIFSAEASLAQGPNDITVVAGDEVFDLVVVRDPSLLRRYGRVLDIKEVWDEGSYLGIDFGEMDLVPDYGQGDFDPGEVIVEFYRLVPSTMAIISDGPAAYDETRLVGTESILADYFYTGDCGHNVWNFLLDGDTIVQIEGPVPLGD